MTRDQPGVLDALSLLSQVADELVVRTVRDTHVAWADRVHGLLRGPPAPDPASGRPCTAASRPVSTAGWGPGCARPRAVSAWWPTGASGPRLETDPRGRFVNAAVNGLIGDRLERERPRLAIRMAVRAGARTSGSSRSRWRAAFPDATGRLVVFLHGLCENESYWNRQREERGTTYGETLAGRAGRRSSCAPTPGCGCAERRRAVGLLQRLVEAWPVDVDAGRAGGPLDGRAGDARRRRRRHGVDRPLDRASSPTSSRSGTPHLGAPLARGIGHGSRGLGRLPETAAFGRILDWRSAGVHDLVVGSGRGRARRCRTPATGWSRRPSPRSPRHPVGRVVGDLLVRVPSAYGRAAAAPKLFPDADVLHVAGADHFDLLNHPRVERALRDWLR